MSLSGKSNINPKIWGPYFWQTIHFTAFGYPETPNTTDREIYFTFYENMMKILPCDKCTNSAQEMFKTSDLKNSLGSKTDLIKWTYSFHKKVNNKLGKDSPTLEEFIHNFSNKSDNSNGMIIFAILLFTIVLLILYKLVYN